MTSRKTTLADGAPACTWPAACLLLVGTALAVTVVLYAATAGLNGVSGTNLSLVVAASVLSALVLVWACFSGGQLWLEPRSTAGERGPVSPWRLGCFLLAAFTALVVFILALVALGSLGTSGYGALVAAVVVSGVVIVFFVGVGLYSCAERA